MNRKFLSVPFIAALLFLLVGGVLYWTWLQKSGAPAEGTVSSSTSPSAPVQKISSPTGTTHSSAFKGSLIASIKSATVPFTESFTLSLNAGPSCSQMTYVMSFGDNTEGENIDIPQNVCTKPYTVVVSHQYQKAGLFTAMLSTRLVGVGIGTTLSQVTITAKNQVVTTGTTQFGTFTTSPVSGSVPLTVNFTVSATDSSESSGIYYTITFGDSQTATFSRTNTPTLSHVYTAVGNYVVIVTRRTQCSSVQCSGPSTPLGTIFITAPS